MCRVYPPEKGFNSLSLEVVLSSGLAPFPFMTVVPGPCTVKHATRTYPMCMSLLSEQSGDRALGSRGQLRERLFFNTMVTWGMGAFKGLTRKRLQRTSSPLQAGRHLAGEVFQFYQVSLGEKLASELRHLVFLLHQVASPRSQKRGDLSCPCIWGCVST